MLWSQPYSPIRPAPLRGRSAAGLRLRDARRSVLAVDASSASPRRRRSRAEASRSSTSVSPRRRSRGAAAASRATSRRPWTVNQTLPSRTSARRPLPSVAVAARELRGALARRPARSSSSVGSGLPARVASISRSAASAIALAIALAQSVRRRRPRRRACRRAAPRARSRSRRSRRRGRSRRWPSSVSRPKPRPKPVRSPLARTAAPHRLERLGLQRRAPPGPARRRTGRSGTGRGR